MFVFKSLYLSIVIWPPNCHHHSFRKFISAVCIILKYHYWWPKFSIREGVRE